LELIGVLLALAGVALLATEFVLGLGHFLLSRIYQHLLELGVLLQ